MSGISVIVVELEGGGCWPSQTGLSRPFLAFPVSNPSLKASGVSVEDALEKLKRLIVSHAEGSNVKRVTVHELSFDDLIVKQVMDE